MLFIIGCQATTPKIPSLETLDPFRFIPATPQNFVFPENNLTETHSENKTQEPVEPENPIIVETDEKETIFSFEPDAVEPMTENEQAELLAKNLWEKNLARISMLDTGRVQNVPKLSPEERQRREQMIRLNMSNKELANRQNQQFEQIDGSTSDWRWMHRGVEKIHAVSTEYRTDPNIFFQNKYKGQRVLQANAAILRGRDGDPAAVRLLMQLVQSEATHIFIRCAAAETLGRMPTVTVDDLIPLLDGVKDREVKALNQQSGEMEPKHQTGIAEIWEELLIAIAEKIAPWEHDCFLEPFYSSSSKVRLETAKIWRRESLQKRPEGTLPEKFLEIARREHNPAVRVEIIQTLAFWDVSDLYRLLENDLRHPIADVRNAAMVALADTRNREAIPFAKDQLRDSLPANRAAAVSALRKIGEYDEVFKLADDAAAPVKVEVARALADRCTPQTANLAKAYIADRSRDVQRATLESVAGWSIEESGPLLLTAAKSMHREIRYQAVDMLAQRGVSYNGFDPESRPESQTAQHQELVDIFRDKTGVDPRLDFTTQTGSQRQELRSQESQSPERKLRDITATAASPEPGTERALEEVRRCLDDWSDRSLSQAERQMLEHRLKQHGQRLMPMIDYLMTNEERRIPESLDRVFAEVDPMFGEIEKLRTGDINAKRNAAQELARWGAVKSPSNLAAKRIIDLTARETDSMVLVSLLSSLKNADPEMVCRLARPLLQSQSAEVRRVSCEMLMQFGSAEDIPLLHEALDDSSDMVVLGALRAIDYLWDESADNSAVLATLKSMLHQQKSPTLQVDVATTLHRLGQPEGAEAVRRFAASSDYRVKAHLAVRVAQMGDRAFVPILIRYLDDSNGTVRARALEGLPMLVGEDIGRSGVSSSNVAQTQQQIDRWKAWGRERR